MSLIEQTFHSEQDLLLESSRPHPGKFPSTTQISERTKPSPTEKPAVINDPVRLPRETAGQGIKDELILENAEGTYNVPQMEFPTFLNSDENSVDHVISKLNNVMHILGPYEVASHIKIRTKRRIPSFVRIGVRPLEMGHEIVIPQS